MYSAAIFELINFHFRIRPKFYPKNIASLRLINGSEWMYEYVYRKLIRLSYYNYNKT